MGVIVKSFVQENSPKSWWEISYAGSWNGERVEEERYILAKDSIEVKRVLLQYLNPYRVERDFARLEFKIVEEPETDKVWPVLD